MITGHNIDRYIIDFRSILSLGSKRIGLFVGSGAPASIRIKDGTLVDSGGKPLIETIVPMTKSITEALQPDFDQILQAIKTGLGGNPNIESILSRARAMGGLLGDQKVQEISGQDYKRLEEAICGKIGEMVAVKLPEAANPYAELVGWIAEGRIVSHALFRSAACNARLHPATPPEAAATANCECIV